MTTKDAEFLKRLQATFQLEAEEHLRALAVGLIDLEKAGPGDPQAVLVEDLFREIHSLKGAARSVDLRTVEALCHAMEGVFSKLKRKTLRFSPAIGDLLLQGVDALRRLVIDLEAGMSERERQGIGELGTRLNRIDVDAIMNGTAPTTPSVPPIVAADAALPLPGKCAPLASVRVPLRKMEPLLRQAEELIQAKVAGQERVRELLDLQVSLNAAPSADPQQRAWQRKMAGVVRGIAHDHRTLRRQIDEHLDAMKEIMMLPLTTLVEGFPRLIRDVAKDQGKLVEFTVSGADSEIDKRVLEEIREPFHHLLRNCLDHGIQKPHIRKERGKPETGTIALAFIPKDSRRLEVLLSDDGCVIDPAAIGAKAVEAGILSPEDRAVMSEKELLEVVFRSGFTTSPLVTDISGRGLGLSIVRDKIERLGGEVELRSRPGEGTTVRLLLPLTASTFRGVLIRAGDRVFVIPTRNIQCARRLHSGDISTVGARETFSWEGRVISLVPLGGVLGIAPSRRAADSGGNAAAIRVLVAGLNGVFLGFQVDEVLEEGQFLVKDLGRQLKRVRNFAGATVLGNGTIAPVIDLNDLVQSALQWRSPLQQAGVGVEPAVVSNILVVDDSITARTLLKTILEGEGYQVQTAVDGFEAFLHLGREPFDLVVTDVDMPRLNGFDLTAKIRADKTLSSIPVVLVTALDSRDDRERGMEVGADAYIVKRSFDQSNLLEVIKKLL